MYPPKIRMVKRIREQIWDKAEIDDGEGELLLQDPPFKKTMKVSPLTLWKIFLMEKKGVVRSLQNTTTTSTLKTLPSALPTMAIVTKLLLLLLLLITGY